MEKKIYEKPVMQVEAFVANHYIANCGDTEYGEYLFECTAGQKEGYAHGMIYYETYGSPDVFNYRTGSMGIVDVQEERVGGFHPCGKKHSAPTTDEFTNGWFVPCQWNGSYHYGYQYNKVFKVVIWEGDGDLHCTPVLDREKWEVVKS